jgi:hypothetical protein
MASAGLKTPSYHHHGLELVKGEHPVSVEVEPADHGLALVDVQVQIQPAHHQLRAQRCDAASALHFVHPERLPAPVSFCLLSTGLRFFHQHLLGDMSLLSAAFMQSRSSASEILPSLSWSNAANTRLK